MVSLWPFKSEDTSPASFEKALSSLAVKISKSQTQLDSLRQQARRLKALWTLYAVFAYLLCAIILFLVVGWQNWTPVEYTAVSGSPLFIYIIRLGITSYYNYRIDTASYRLEGQQAERTKTVEKLKTATKYNSTQELLEKYGGATPAPKPKKPKTPGNKVPQPSQNKDHRTGTGPPPLTANISRPSQNQLSTPIPRGGPPIPNPPSFTVPPGPSQPEPAEFAPNAFSGPPQYSQGGGDVIVGGNWYDRVLDLLMGEDETNPKNRMALICHNCRLVNGQAPPGIKTPAELGKWRCFGCRSWNGEEDEVVKVVKEMKERIELDRSVFKNVNSVQDEAIDGNHPVKGNDEVSDEKEESESEEDIIEESKRGRPKNGKKA